MPLDTFDPIIQTSDDGFVTPEIEQWNIEKYKLIGQYLRTFTQNMRHKSEDMIYVDLTAGGGVNRIKETGEIILGSPLIALSNPISFSKYIFCEKETELVQALKIRINKEFRRKNVVIFGMDVNTMTDKFSYYIPPTTAQNKVSGICIIDAFSISVHFDVVKELAKLGMNFLVIFSLPMNDYHDYNFYNDQRREGIVSFLGTPMDQLEGLNQANDNELYFRYIVKNYKNKIESLGYKTTGSFQPLVSKEMNLPFYYVGYFAQDHSAERMWEQVQKNAVSRSQTDLFKK